MTRDLLLARAAALRAEARLRTGMPRARLLSAAVDAERMAASIARLTSPHPIATEAP